MTKKLTKKEMLKLILEAQKDHSFFAIKADALADCKNQLGIKLKGALDLIDCYLVCAYEAGKTETKNNYNKK